MSALKKRIAPSVPLSLELTDDTGEKFVKNFKLSFDFNAKAEIEERTGLNLLTAEVWTNLSAKVLSVMFWAAALANHPEYRTKDAEGNETDEGLEVIRSYMELSNTDAIYEALWDSYFISLPKDRREALEASRAAIKEAEKLRAEGKPLPLATTPESKPAPPLDGLNSGLSQSTTSVLPLTTLGD